LKEALQHIEAFAATSLGEMSAIKLLNRHDTKYVFHERKLAAILDDLKENYYVLEIDGKRLLSYENQYFDTEDFTFYNKHQRGMLNRTKIRIRKYVESDLSFIEIKKKTNKSRTIKNRIALTAHEDIKSDRVINFIESNSTIKVSELSEILLINFQRITLAHKNLEDRCTLDINLHASWNGKNYNFEHLVIAELKQEKFKHSSDFNLSLKKNKVYSGGFSKYCFSFSSLNSDLKNNSFKPKIHQLNKILS
jgi:hypothetical protein